MEKDTNIIFRVNSKLKNSATKVARKYGVSLTELITACLVEFDKRDFVPLNIRRHFPNKDIDNSQLTLMLIKMQLKDIINKYAKGKVNKVYFTKLRSLHSSEDSVCNVLIRKCHHESGKKSQRMR